LAVIKRWNDQLALGRDMLSSPTIRAVLLAARRDVFCRAAAPARQLICGPSIATFVHPYVTPGEKRPPAPSTRRGKYQTVRKKA
jgi:hypothetical protein